MLRSQRGWLPANFKEHHKSMDLTEEQWNMVEPLIPMPPRRPDGRGRPWRDPREVLNARSFGSFARVLLGAICLIATHRTRPAIVASRCGSERAY